MADLELDLYAQQEEERKRQAATHMPAAAPATVPVPDPATLAAITGPTPAAPAAPPMDLQLQQPPPEPAAAPLPAPPNLDSTHTTNTSQKTILSPEYKANLAGQKVNDAGQIQGLEEKGALDRDIAVKRQQQADEEVKFAAARSKAIGEAQSWGDEQIKTATDKFTAAQEQYRGRKIEDFWADKTIGTKVLAAVSVALGTLGAGISGGRTPNDALKIMESAINLDYQRQKANIEKEGQDLQLLRAGIGDARLAKADKLNDLNGRTAAAWGEVEAKFRASLAAKGVDAATIDNDARVVAARNQQLAFERQALEPTLKRVSTTIETVKNDPRLVAANAAKGVAAERAEARDENGKVIGHVVGGKNAAMQFEQHDTTFTRAEKNLQALYDDVKKNGERVLPGTDAAKRRDSLYANAVGAVAGTSPLGKTDEAVQLEKKAIGSSGAGTLLGASASVIKSKITEVNEQRQLYRRGTLIPVEGGAAAMADPGAAQAKQRLSDQEFAQVTDWIMKNPNNPAVEKAKQLLRAQSKAN